MSKRQAKITISPQTRTTFADRLKLLMKEKKITLKDIGGRLGKSTSAVGSWTQGRNWPEVETLIALSDILGVEVEYLTHGMAPPSPEQKSREIDGAIAGIPDPEADLYRQAVRKLVDEVLLYAGNNHSRLGWIEEQLKAHLAIPKHWRKNAQP